jgi:hypothetical protein
MTQQMIPVSAIAGRMRPRRRRGSRLDAGGDEFAADGLTIEWL